MSMTAHLIRSLQSTAKEARRIADLTTDGLERQRLRHLANTMDAEARVLGQRVAA